MKDVCCVRDCVEVHFALMVRVIGNSAQVCQKQATDHCVQTQVKNSSIYPFCFNYNILDV